REEEHEGAVDAFGVEDLQQLSQVCGLAGLVADVLPVQPDRGAGVRAVLKDLHNAAAPVARAAVGGSAEAGDRDRLSCCDEVADAFPELAGDLGGADELDGHDVEGRPVDPLGRYGSVGDPAPETLAAHG